MLISGAGLRFRNHLIYECMILLTVCAIYKWMLCITTRGESYDFVNGICNS